MSELGCQRVMLRLLPFLLFADSWTAILLPVTLYERCMARFSDHGRAQCKREVCPSNAPFQKAFDPL